MSTQARPEAPRTATSDDLASVDAWWRAANYLSVGQIYLLDNPLLREPLQPEHVKPRLLGHWGTTPGLTLLWAHLCRVIRARRRPVLYVCGPGHGGPAMVASTWLEGSYTEMYPSVTRDEAGMRTLFRQFSFPGGVPSHAAPETPGSINEGGELGYSLAHAYGAAFDHPELVVAAVVGDGEAETGALAASWHSNKLLDPRSDGAVLPILHLNGWKIANPTILARIGWDELRSLLIGYGHEPRRVAGSDPAEVHEALAAALDDAMDRIASVQEDARAGGAVRRPCWPMIVLETPKGWTGPSEVDGLAVEGTWRSHQVPLADVRHDAGHREALEAWLRSYRPEELFDERGAPRPGIVALAPDGDLRMGATPYANGGRLLRDLDLADWRAHGVAVDRRGRPTAEPTRHLGRWLRDVVAADGDPARFLLVGPDEVASNRLDAVYEATAKRWSAGSEPVDEHLRPGGQVAEILSEHVCQGWLEGYLLTGRHGLFTTYEAFAHIVDSMFNQHAKWLQTSAHLPWRRPIASLNYLLSSHVWRQDHNGFSHQDPGFIDHVVSRKAEVVRVYFPPDTNCLLSTMDHCLRSRGLVNVVIAGKQPGPSWLDPEEAALHCTRGVGIWPWASTDDDGDPDVVLAACGDIPTVEALAAAALLREHLPSLKVRFVNLVDLLRLQPAGEHPHGLPDREFDAIFTTDRPVLFAYHGYPWLLHRLAYRRAGHEHLHVRGFVEQGTTTTPFDMLMMNTLDRYHLVMDVIDRVPGLARRAARVRQEMVDRRTEARAWTRAHGEDHPDVTGWAWPG